MAISVNVICVKKDKNDSEGVLFIRTIENVKPKPIIKKKSLQIKMSPKVFSKHFKTDKMQFSKELPNHQEYNDKIHSLLKTLDRYDNKVELIPTGKVSFLDFWKSYNKSISNKGSRDKQQVVLVKFEKFLKSVNLQDIKFTEITPSLIRDVKYYFETSKDPSKLSPNTVTHYLRMIKQVIDVGVSEGQHIYLVHPFSSIKLKHDKRLIKRKILEDNDITKLLTQPISDTKINYDRDTFTFQVFSNGMRVSDVLTLRWNCFRAGVNSSQARLTYGMFKTDYTMDIPLNVNLCIIICKLMGQPDKYEKTLSQMTFEYKDFFKPKDTKIYKLNVYQILDKIKERTVEIEQSDLEIFQYSTIQTKFVDGIEEYKGFYFNKDRETITTLIDYYHNVRLDIEKTFIHFTAREIQRFIKKNDCSNHFVFNYLDNGKFNDVGSDNDFGHITDEQYDYISKKKIVYNRRLKVLGNECGIKTNISSHVGRHTFAQLLLQMDNVNIYDISQAMGHSDIKITSEYLGHGFNKGKLDNIGLNLANKYKKGVF